MNRSQFLTLLHWTVSTPTHLLVSTWVGFAVMWFCSPLVYNREMSIVTFFFVAACLIGYGAGAVFGQGRGDSATTQASSADVGPKHGERYYRKLNSRIRLFAVVGLIGTACIAIDKLFITGLDFSGGLGELRLSLGEERVGPRSLLLWVGMAAFSFTDVSVMLFVLAGEACNRITASWVFLISFCPAGVAVLYGGRSMGLVLLMLVFCTAFVRIACGMQFFPKAHYMRSMIIVHSTLLFVGTIYIFTVRGAALGYETGSQVVESYANTLNATISPELRQMMDGDSLEANLASNLMMSWAYTTQGLTELDYILTENPDAGPWYGCYQGWLVYRGIVTLLGLPDRTLEIEGSLQDHSGLLLSAWGSSYMDFGLLSPVFTFVVGVISGTCFRAARLGIVGAQLLLSFMYAFVVFSPLHSLAATGNALQVLLSIVAATLILPGHRARAAVAAPETS